MLTVYRGQDISINPLNPVFGSTSELLRKMVVGATMYIHHNMVVIYTGVIEVLCEVVYKYCDVIATPPYSVHTPHYSESPSGQGGQR